MFFKVLGHQRLACSLDFVNVGAQNGLFRSLSSFEGDAAGRFTTDDTRQCATGFGDDNIVDVSRINLSIGIENVHQDGVNSLVAERTQEIGADDMALSFQLMTRGTLFSKQSFALNAAAFEFERGLVLAQDLCSA